MTVDDIFGDLVGMARRMGASEAAIVEPEAVVVEDSLALMCREPRCRNYGLSPSCPPHVPGPDAMRRWAADCKKAIVIKIDVPMEILLSDEQKEIMALLHEIAATVEQTAVRRGYLQTRAFAGGSCRQLFCRDQPDCRVLEGRGECRNPDRARPSMSGFGIDVGRLMAAAGWKLARATAESDPDSEKTGSLCAMVLVA